MDSALTADNDTNYRPLLDGPFFTARAYVVAGEKVSLTSSSMASCADVRTMPR